MRIFVCLILLSVVVGGKRLHFEPMKLKSIPVQYTFEQAWGTYKPQLIHGVSNQSSVPLTFSTMYYNPETLRTLRDLRYKVAERLTDEIVYNYNYHNGRDFAVQSIHDPLIGINYTTNFFKLLSQQFHQQWVDVLQNQPRFSKGNSTVNFVYLISWENFLEFPQSQSLSLQVKTIQNQGIQIQCTINGVSSYFTIQAQNSTLNLQSYKVYNTDPANNWDMYRTIYEDLGNFTKSSTIPPTNGTLVALVFSYRVNEFFEILTRYDTYNPIFYTFPLASQLDANIASFTNQFFKTYQNSSDKTFLEHKFCAIESFSNLMGGYQFTYGNLTCEQPDLPNCKGYLPIFTLTPSRYGFPRPFLWDDGFHTLFSCTWAPDFCKTELQTWFNTISPEGWIPREQPRGPELRSYISFNLVENPLEANPPTFMWELYYLQNLNNASYASFVKNLLPAIEAWTSWWDNTQGNGNGLYKWWGPDPKSNLGSGMDDWPRYDGDYYSKYNIDASSWMQFMTNQLSHLYHLNGDELKARYFGIVSNQIRKSIFQFMYDQKTKIFFDLLEDSKNQTKLSPHLGYPNFLPLALGMLDPETDLEILEAQASALLDENTLWSDFGIISLSKQDSFYGKGSNYWRGPIWINIQFMILRAIKLYYWSVPGLRNLYTKLRDNVVNNVCKNFENSGFFFEIFNQPPNDTGKGTGNHPFNGWTSVITAIINENYLIGPNQYQFYGVNL